MRFVILFLIFCSVIQSVFASDVFTSTVVAVIHGNIIEVTAEEGQVQRLTLVGIDCPEPGQPFYDKARKALEKLVLNREVRVEMKGKNRWGHYLAIVTLLKNGVDPRIELLEEGLAWTAEKNPEDALEQVRIKAQTKERGLWSEENPTAPWIYRRDQSMMQAKSS